MTRLKKILCLAALSALCLWTAKNAPNSDSEFIIFCMGLSLAFCIPAFELEHYLTNKRK
jgi:hypothetical protein